MDKQTLLDNLETIEQRLLDDVGTAYNEKGANHGNARLVSWREMAKKFLQEHLPITVPKLDEIHAKSTSLLPKTNEDAYSYFLRSQGEKYTIFFLSLMADIKNGSYNLTSQDIIVKKLFHEQVFASTATATMVKKATQTKSKKVFIVHGHNNEVKERTARFIHKLGFDPIILHEQASGGSTTIIEKIEEYSDTTDFAIVLYTADDLGEVKAQAESGNLKARARQNVVFEHGLLIGKLGRKNVVPLVADGIEIPNDISGVVYVRDGWEMKIAQEMKKAGYEIDLNKLF
jgi:predicted nucleotide-binding protein